ncbi:hypothetical protein PQX77_015657 [Marasmius sp. AFHP31]|nr:hypothetical protein PQX77_015657 [Marasmius sp. AFHP31]
MTRFVHYSHGPPQIAMSSDTSFSSTLQQRDDQSSLLDHPGLSSPLILVFMAMGVCSAAGLSFFAWRRFLFPYDPAALRTGNDEHFRREKEAAELSKPTLFDVWTRANDQVVGIAWDEVLPLSLMPAGKDRHGTIRCPKSQEEIQSSGSVVREDGRSIAAYTSLDTAQLALAIVLPQAATRNGNKGGPGARQYAFGVTEVNIVRGEDDSHEGQLRYDKQTLPS